MPLTQAKYHHLIPQTYMSAWADERGTLRVMYLVDSDRVFERNKKKIAGITNFHSIKAGMPICTQVDANVLFAPLSDYIVRIDGNVIQDPLILNELYWKFDKWEISRVDGSAVGKKKIRHEIDQKAIRDIEVNWAEKYENGWNGQVEKIERFVQNHGTCAAPEFDKEYLTKFYVALDWRGFCANQQFEEMFHRLACKLLSDNEIPEERRTLPFLKTPSDEIRHYLLLKYYREYLNDAGVIYRDAVASLQRTGFLFLVTTESERFETSDTPAFTYIRRDGKLIGVLPITPRILMLKVSCRDKRERCAVFRVSDVCVRKCNELIRSNAREFVILSHDS